MTEIGTLSPGRPTREVVRYPEVKLSQLIRGRCIALKMAIRDAPIGVDDTARNQLWMIGCKRAPSD